MVQMDGNFAVGCGPGTYYPYIHIFQCKLERTDAITNEVLEPVMFVVALYIIFLPFLKEIFTIWNLRIPNSIVTVHSDCNFRNDWM
jgi:hypothetical protein